MTSALLPARRRTPVAAAVAAVIAGVPLAAFAADEDTGDMEVLVTATRREQTVLEIPYNITAVSGSALDAAQIVDNVDLMRKVTGVNVVDRGYRNSGVINGVMIRGVNANGSALGDYQLSTVPTVSTYVNDTPVYANFILKDIDRVEVLRGPQGTLYGSGSLGGTVRYILNAPKIGEVEGSIAGSLSDTDGSDDVGYTLDGVLNVPLGEKAAFRVAGSWIDLPGIVDYANVYVLDSNGNPVAPNGVTNPQAQYYRKEDADTVEIWFARAAFLWKPTDIVDVTLSYVIQNDDIGGRRQVTRGPNGLGVEYGYYENGSIQLEPSSREVEVAALEASIDLGFATLTSSTSYYDHTGDSNSENTGFYAQAGFLEYYYYSYPRPMASAERTYGEHAWVQEFRLVSQGDSRLTWTAGAFYMDQDLSATQTSYLRGYKQWWDATGFPPAAVTGDIDFDYNREENFKDLALFGEVGYRFTDAFQMTGGLRYYDNKFENDTFVALPLYAGLAPPTNTSFEVNDDGLLWKVNASYEFEGSRLLYATISEGYRRGGSNAVPTTGFFAESPAWLSYDSDSATNYELGFKGATDRFQYSIAAFYVDWKTIQVDTSTPTWGFFVAQNGGDASTQGVEVDFEAAITERLIFNIGYAYTDAKLDQPVLSPSSGAVVANSGNLLPGTAENVVSGALAYTMPVGNWEWTTRVNGYYQSSTRNAVQNSARFNVELPSFSLWGMSTGFTSEKMDVTLWGKNLSNEEGFTGLFTEAYMGTAPAVNYFGNGAKSFLSSPRTFGLSLAYRF